MLKKFKTSFIGCSLYGCRKGLSLIFLVDDQHRHRASIGICHFHHHANRSPVRSGFPPSICGEQREITLGCVSKDMSATRRWAKFNFPVESFPVRYLHYIIVHQNMHVTCVDACIHISTADLEPPFPNSRLTFHQLCLHDPYHYARPIWMNNANYNTTRTSRFVCGPTASLDAESAWERWPCRKVHPHGHLSSRKTVFL